MAVALRIVMTVALLVSMGAGRSHEGRTRAVGSPPCLILCDWFGDSPCPTPAFVRDHQAYLRTLPFDGLVVYLRRPDLSDNLTLTVLTDRRIGREVIAGVLAPLRGIALGSMSRNFALVVAGGPPDVFDDWSVPVCNLRELARAANESGLAGICFDNEGYVSTWADYPEGVRYPWKSLREYEEQARLRGRQAMEAMVAEFPDITFISLHGPYVSDPRAPAPLFPQWQCANELLGPFFCGGVLGAGRRAVCVDGGELYQLRTDSEFRESHLWRKTTIASSGTEEFSGSESLRAAWSATVSVAFGVYDRPFGGSDMNPDILRGTLARALRHSDGYVWLYVEGASFLTPAGRGGAGEAWVDAVRRARGGAR